METNWGTRLHPQSYFRLPRSVFGKAPATHTQIIQESTGDSSLGRYDPDSREDEERGRTDCSAVISEFHLLNVPGTQRGWNNETYFQPQATQPLRSHNTVQTDKHLQNSRLSTTSRFSSKDRSIYSKPIFTC